jgi:ubiquinone/menaquinone biosynthesis C-methylase UbiE
MTVTEKSRVCSVERAGALDAGIRKLVHNPHKILKPYVKEGMSAMDLGCGPGFFTIEMAKLVGKNGKVTAVDLQEGMLEIVRKKVTKTNLQDIVEFHKCPNDRIGLSKTFDFILVFYMLHEVPDQPSFLKEVFSLLKPDGKVLIVEPKFHVTKSDFDSSEEILKSIGFEIVEEPKVFISRAVLIRRKF